MSSELGCLHFELCLCNWVLGLILIICWGFWDSLDINSRMIENYWFEEKTLASDDEVTTMGLCDQGYWVVLCYAGLQFCQIWLSEAFGIGEKAINVL